MKTMTTRFTVAMGSPIGAVMAEGQTARATLLALAGRDDRGDAADPIWAMREADGVRVDECDGCYGALTSHRTHDGLWLCRACRGLSLSR
jgi:hypothetical protein